MLMPQFGRIQALKYKGADASSIVTERDIAVETFIADELQKSRPDIGFVGEEHGGDRSAERFWLCDPIDGTGYYERGVPLCTVMLALIEYGEVTFGAVYDFVNDKLYHAEHGKGAFENDVPIHVSDRGLRDGYVFLESDIEQDGNVALFVELPRQTRYEVTMAAGSDFVEVATGRREARITKNPFGKDYDYAPGALLVKEAGGIVTNIGKRTFDYRNLDSIAANPTTYKDLTEGKDAIFPIK